MLPGFENKGYPDVLTIGVERFQCAEALFNPRDLLGKDHMIAGVHKYDRWRGGSSLSLRLPPTR